MIPRTAATKIQELSKKFPVVAILGPRQSGKTTLVRSVFPDYQYISLENPDTQKRAIDDPRLFLSSLLKAKGVILDEIQRVPTLFSYLQGIVDEQKKMGQFILTGSHNFLLLENITQTLAGRVGFLQLLPLSQDELSKSQKLPRSLYELLFSGSYPPIYDRNIPATDWYPNYILTYVEKDVRLIKNIPDLSKFQTFLKLCAGRVGQVVNFSSLASECGINHNTAKSWISILEASFVVYLLHPYYKNFNKRLVQHPKLYFYDTGLLCSLLGIQNAEQVESHYARGSIFESFIVSEVLKYYLNQGMSAPLYFWRDHRGEEVDLIIEQGQKLKAVEIKAGHTFSSDYFSVLKKFQSIANVDVKETFVVYAGDESQPHTSGELLSWKEMEKMFNE